jgi:hypothetical protein
MFIDVKPENWAIPNNCFLNVQKMIDKFGGTMIVGWTISEPSTMIEANYHAVYMDTDNICTDITPKEFPIEKILFVEDKNSPYIGRTRDNFRLNTTDNPLLDDLISLAKLRYKILNYKDNAYKTKIEIPENDSVIINSYIDKTASALELHILKGNYPNSPCFCGRNKRYFECHGDDIHKLMSAYNKKYPDNEYYRSGGRRSRSPLLLLPFLIMIYNNF